MRVTINIDDPEPAFAQLIAQIKQGVLAKQVVPGDALPSIRQLAQDLSLNPKTVAKAYRML
ncbi:MAG: GntR family transcriptional regulator [Robiginitomaculum sp.]|nr:GntR family transcriptional regulator [Robiginitomaculum sp.]